MTTHFNILPGEPHGQRSLAGYSPWSRKESDTTEQVTHTHIMENNLKRIYICFPGGTSGKEPACQYSGDIREAGLIPRWRRSPGGGHCNPLQYSCLENQRSLAGYSPGSQRVGQD